MGENLRVVNHTTPLERELTALFDAIPTESVVARLQKTEGRGPKGYPALSLFNAFIASYWIGTGSTSGIARALQDNPALAAVCGFDPTYVPSRPTLRRFFRRLAEHRDLIQNVLAEVTTELKDRLPEFGDKVAVDASTIPAHSSPDKQPISDPEASWTAKGYKVGSKKRQWHFGYKLHMIADATHELPIVAYVTTASSADSQNLLPLLDQAWERFDWLRPRYVLADKGYDSVANHRGVAERYAAFPIIPMRAMRPGAKKRRKGTEFRTDPAIPRDSAYWKALYARRTSVERVFGRLKESRRLEKHCFRGLAMIETHCLMSVLTLQARALAQHRAHGDLRACLRKVA